MLVRDSEIVWSLQAPRANDHRKEYVVHLWDKSAKCSIVKSFYAYYRKDVVAIVREYAVRCGNYSIQDIRLGR
jgi:hypothetical protein